MRKSAVALAIMQSLWERGIRGDLSSD